MNSNVTETTCGTCGLALYGASCVVCEREAAYTRMIVELIAPKGAYKVLLASVGNPDFGQDSRRALPGVPRQTLCVASIADASKGCRAYIEHYELGGGNWRGGEVKKDGDRKDQLQRTGVGTRKLAHQGDSLRQGRVVTGPTSPCMHAGTELRRAKVSRARRLRNRAKYG